MPQDGGQEQGRQMMADTDLQDGTGDHGGAPQGNTDLIGVADRPDTGMVRAGPAPDVLFGGAGRDITTGAVHHLLDATVDGDRPAAAVHGRAGRRRLDRSHWITDGVRDVFVKPRASGTDIIDDFRLGADLLDLTAFGLLRHELPRLILDVGWAAQIELAGLSGHADDRVFLRNIDARCLGASSFRF